jgi:hypothetical protein
MPATLATYPDYLDAVQKLVGQHRALRGERLHLAVYYAPPNRPKRDIYLFEVIDDFGGGRIDADKKLFAFAYGSTPGFPLPEGISLRMVLTNPTELGQAIAEDWKRVQELSNAKAAGHATVLHADVMGKKFWKQIG